MAQTTIGTIVIAPGDITPITADFADFLDRTADVIYDHVGTADGLEIHDNWFTESDCTLLVGPGVKGRNYVLNYDIVVDPESGESYHREIKVRCR